MEGHTEHDRPKLNSLSLQLAKASHTSLFGFFGVPFLFKITLLIINLSCVFFRLFSVRLNLVFVRLFAITSWVVRLSLCVDSGLNPIARCTCPPEIEIIHRRQRHIFRTVLHKQMTNQKKVLKTPIRNIPTLTNVSKSNRSENTVSPSTKERWGIKAGTR